jgi:hypothetical protein
VNGFLDRALTDPRTGLPNLIYFNIIRDWEQRRAARRNYSVRVIRFRIAGGDDRDLERFKLRLCQNTRGSDLIASNGTGEFLVLLTDNDAENIDRVTGRFADAGEPGPPARELYAMLAVTATVEPVHSRRNAPSRVEPTSDPGGESACAR